MDKVEQAKNSVIFYRHRLDDLENAHLNFVQSKVVLDPVEVPNANLRHGTPSIRRPLSISPTLKIKKVWGKTEMQESGVEMSRSFHDDPRILDGTILAKILVRETGKCKWHHIRLLILWVLGLRLLVWCLIRCSKDPRYLLKQVPIPNDRLPA